MQRPSRPIKKRALLVWALLALASAAVFAPISSGAHRSSTATRIAHCKAHYPGKSKKQYRARQQCVKKARERSKAAAPPKAGAENPGSSGSGSTAPGGGSASSASAPAGESAPLPGPPAPEGPQTLQLTAADTSVSVGSSVIVASPGPLTSLTAIAAPVAGAEAGVTVEAENGGIAISATTGAALGSMEMTLEGMGCTASECERPVVINLRLTVGSIEAPAGNLESFSNPSADRIATATEGQLADEVLVMLGTTEHPGSRVEAEDAATFVGAKISGGLFEEGIYQLRWTTPQNIATRIAELEGLPFVSAVTPSYVGTTEAQSAYAPFVAPSYDQPYWTWRYEQIHAAQAWAQSVGVGVPVGIIDAGNVFAGSPDLNVSKTLNSIAIPAAHATNVAGLACAKPTGTDMVGIAWGCPIVSTYVEAPGGTAVDAADMAAMQRVIKSPGVRVVNISLGARSRCVTQAERNEIEAWIGHEKAFFRRFLNGAGSNIVWTFSAGNNCMYGPSSPWAANDDLPNVIDVAATNADGRLASFSNYGVDVAAPGGVEPTSPPIDLNASCDSDSVLNAGRCGLLSSTVGACPGGYCAERGEMAGTSMAAPVVAGVAALVASKHPLFSAAQIGGCIKSTAGTEGVGSTGAPDGQPGGAYANPPLSYIGAPIPIVNAAAAVACQGGATNVAVTPNGPRSGPAGFGLEVVVPACLVLEVSFDGVPAFSEYNSAGLSEHFQPTTLSTLSIGSHQMSFTCRNENGDALWTSTGFEIDVTAGPIELGLESDVVPAGGELVFTTGPSLGEARCPALPGVDLSELSIYLDDTEGDLVAYRLVPMPDGAATERLVVPAGADPDKEYAALDRCTYRNGTGEVGVFQFAWDWGNVDVTAGSGAAAGHLSSEAAGPTVPAVPAEPRLETLVAPAGAGSGAAVRIVR